MKSEKQVPLRGERTLPLPLASSVTFKSQHPYLAALGTGHQKITSWIRAAAPEIRLPEAVPTGPTITGLEHKQRRKPLLVPLANIYNWKEVQQ